VLVVLAALVIVGIFVLEGLTSSTERSPEPSPSEGSAQTGPAEDPSPANARPAVSRAEDPRERPDAPAAPGDEAAKGEPKAIPGGGGLPPVSGMDAPDEPSEPDEPDEPSADGTRVDPAPADEDAERLVYAPDRAGIRAAIGGEHEHLRDCYAAWLQADPSIGGRVKVQFVIADPDETDEEALARIAGVKIMDTTLTGESAQFVEGCVMNVMSSLRFDPPADGQLVVNYPFIFRTDDEPPAEK